jgi:hypothetical protein
VAEESTNRGADATGAEVTRGATQIEAEARAEADKRYLAKVEAADEIAEVFARPRD